METLCKRATSVAHLTNFSFELFYKIFTEDASRSLLYHSAKKSKMTKTQIKGGGSCLKKQWKREANDFFNFRQPPNTLHIHSSDRERMWLEAHCHVRDFREFLTMTKVFLENIIVFILNFNCRAQGSCVISGLLPSK